jgi:hypothetical protein
MARNKDKNKNGGEGNTFYFPGQKASVDNQVAQDCRMINNSTPQSYTNCSGEFVYFPKLSGISMHCAIY